MPRGIPNTPRDFGRCVNLLYDADVRQRSRCPNTATRHVHGYPVCARCFHGPRWLQGEVGEGGPAADGEPRQQSDGAA